MPDARAADPPGREGLFPIPCAFAPSGVAGMVLALVSCKRRAESAVRIDQFRLVQVVHEGLYGPVYRGLHEKTQQPVALQILRGTQSKPPLQALQAHLQTLQKLAFPGVPVPLGCGLLPDGAAYLASQWIDGQPLSFRNRARTQALRFAQELSACLSATHQHGIHHLQLHPNQVLVRESTEARPRCFVLDLGLCQLLGPPPTPLPAEALDMLAPERRTDPGLTTNAGAADVYSLGKILQGLLGLAQADTPDGLVSGEGFLSVLQFELGQLQTPANAG